MLASGLRAASPSASANVMTYCMKPYKMKVLNCALFAIMHIVAIFPLEIIASEIASAPYMLQ